MCNVNDSDIKCIPGCISRRKKCVSRNTGYYLSAWSDRSDGILRPKESVYVMDHNMKIAICDDEKTIRDYIEKCVREVNPDIFVEQ